MAFSGTQHELQYACAPTRLTAQYHTLAGFGWIEYLLQLFFYKLHKLVFINDDFNQYILKEWVKQSLNNTTYTIRRFYTFENWKFTRHKKWAVMQNSKLCEFQRVLQHKIIKKEKGMFLIVFITWKKLTMEFYIWELQTRVSWNCGINLVTFDK